MIEERQNDGGMTEERQNDGGVIEERQNDGGMIRDRPLVVDLYIILGTPRFALCWVCQREIIELEFDKVAFGDLEGGRGEI